MKNIKIYLITSDATNYRDIINNDIGKTISEHIDYVESAQECSELGIMSMTIKQLLVKTHSIAHITAPWLGIISMFFYRTILVP